MAIVVILGGSYWGYLRLSDSSCKGAVRLTVAAPAELAPAIKRTADKWAAGGASVGGQCAEVAVTEVNSATMAAAVAGQHKVALTGLGAAPESVKVPDVWIADSSTWLMRLKSEAPGFVPTDLKPVAQSPVVVAMPEPVAKTVGWPDRKLGWKDLLTQLTSSTKLRTGIADPTRDSAGLAGLLALGQAAGAGPQAQATKVSAIKALASSASSLREDLMQKFPASADAGALATSLGAAPLAEEDVVTFNRQKPAVPLVALYLDPSPAPMDYPYAIMPGADGSKVAVAQGLSAQLRSAAFKNELAAEGLRAPDGSFGAGFDRPLGAPEASPAAPTPGSSSDAGDDKGGKAAAGYDAAALSQVLGSWAAITLPGRVLAVFDVSGSMNTKVPTAGDLTRAQVTQRAAAGGLALFDDRWSVGVWLFSTELDGTKPYRQIEPISPLVSARERLQKSIGQIVPKRNGETGLYDTVLEAYKNVRASWEPGKINSVILFTDGENSNPDGISQATLVSQLKKVTDPQRPVRLVIIGIGPGVNQKELETITKATPSGGAFIVPDPAKIGDVFLQALANRSGANN